MNPIDTSASFPAFGSTATVVVTDAIGLQPACAAVAQTVDEFDLACSRFRPDSELMALNRAVGAATHVSPLLLDALGAALRAARLTDGDVDPALGDALVALGYDRDFGLLDPDDGDDLLGAAGRAETGDRAGPGDRAGATVSRLRVAFASVAGWRTIRIDRAAGTVSMGAGVTLDLGATAKALAADRAADRAARTAGCGVLVSLGGDIALGGEAPPSGWRVRVTDDHRAGLEAPGQWITLRSGGLATSSTTVRRWRTEAGSAHHLLDPSDGRPARAVWRTVSVAAATCLDANIATTAAIVRGQRAVSWLESLALPSRLVSADGDSLHLAGWPEVGDDLRCHRHAPGEVAPA
jgi:thiamine biosynthesis lipoprotein